MDEDDVLDNDSNRISFTNNNTSNSATFKVNASLSLNSNHKNNLLKQIEPFQELASSYPSNKCEQRISSQVIVIDD